MIIKTLKSLVLWLEARFPERIIVRPEDLKAMIDKTGELEARVKALEIMTGFGVKATQGQDGV